MSTNNIYSSAGSSGIRKAYIIFILAASFYLYEYALQVSPSVMSDAIMQSFGVDAAGLGTISAFYFYAYAPMQIPAGMLYDKYGPRFLITMAILICVVGTAFYAITTSVAMAATGRFLIGVGSAFSFIGVLVLISRWFPAQKFAVLAGIAQFMSSVGAICGEFPLESLASHTGWRNSMLILAAIGVVLAILTWTIIRDYPDNRVTPPRDLNFKLELQKFKEVIHNVQTWWVGLYAFAVWTPIAVFGSLWGVPFLCSVYHVTTGEAAAASAMIWLGIGIGSPLLGWLSDVMDNRRIPLIIGAVVGVVCSIFMIYTSVSWPVMYILLFGFGFAAGGQTVSFSLVRINNRIENVGTASGFNNMAVLIGGAIFQQVVGYVLKVNWTGEFLNNVPTYSITAYQKSLIILPLCFLAGVISCLYFIKDKSPTSEDLELAKG